MAIDILHKILGIQTGPFDGLTAFSVRKLFFSTESDNVHPSFSHILAKKTRLPPHRRTDQLGVVGMADSKCVTDVGHKVQPPGPSTGDASVNWDL